MVSVSCFSPVFLVLKGVQEEQKVRTHTGLKQHFYKVEHGPGKEDRV